MESLKGSLTKGVIQRERGRFKEERLKCQFPQSSKTIKMEKGLLDEIIRPSLVSLDEYF